MRRALAIGAATLMASLGGCTEESQPAASAPAVAAAVAQPAAAAARCAGPEWRQLDFWVGDWVAEWDGSQKGTTRDEFGDCVIYERFTADDGSLKGMSVSTWRPVTRQWRQTWVDDGGGHFNLVGGPVTGQPHIFELVNELPTPQPNTLRMIWQDVRPDSFTWRWQAQKPGATEWTDQWVIRYRRAPA